MRSYVELPGLAEIVLEESYVLDIECHPGSVVIALDAVLTERHSGYRTPRPDERFCYRRGRLAFERVTRLSWTNQGAPSSSDATGERDWGNVDSFVWDEHEFELDGDWGVMTLTAGGFRFEFE